MIMASSLVKIDIHIIFHVKNNGRNMRSEDLPRIFQYIGGVIRGLNAIPIEIGGMSDHIHILTSLPKAMPLTDFVRDIKSKTHLEMRNFGRFILKAQYYRIFTWKGYEQKDLSTIDPLHLNAQGDKGNASLFVINPTVEFDLKKNWSIVVSGSRFYRHTRYKFYDNVKAHTFELRLGITAHL